ncbi:hypothetical protein B0H14DRAFT_3563044 [Mycena olivaceomarginata]|nr:hypothetical protein B0H14DRAFT_3563044 [Mycena olivaceomarginata]
MSTTRKRPEKMSCTFSRPRHFPHLWSLTVCLGCVHALGASPSTSASTAGTNAGEASRWRSDALLPIAVGSGWQRERERSSSSLDAAAGTDAASASGSDSTSSSAGRSGSGGEERREGDGEQEDMEQDDEVDMDAEVEEGGRVIWGEKLEKLGVHRPVPEVEVGDLEVGPDWGVGGR